MRKRIGHAAISGGLSGLVFSGILLLAGCNGRAPRAGTQLLSASQIADRATPATIEVVAQFQATGDVDELEPDVDKLATAVRAESPADASREQAIEKLVDILYSDPARYLRLGDRRRVTKSIYALGTGFIVTPDGYILTNAHVVEPEDEELKKAVVSSVADLVGQDADEIEHSLEKYMPGRTINAEASDRLKSVLAEQYARRATFSFSRDVHILMPTAHGDSKVQELACEVKRVGVPTPGKDVAILKIDGSDLPTLPLARGIAGGGVRTGADLYVLGYPGSVALFPNFTASSSVEPSLTSGHVSGIKDMSGGFQVIQTDAAINPGNSGGPVLNDYGEVVGLATFKLKDSEGVNFAISVDLAQQFLNDLDVVPHQSEFTRQFDEALAQYDRPGHGRALHMFKALSESHPGLSAPRAFVRELGGGSVVDSSSEPSSQESSSPVRPAKPAYSDRGDAERSSQRHERHGVPGVLLAVIGALLVGGLIALIVASRR